MTFYHISHPKVSNVIWNQGKIVQQKYVSSQRTLLC